MEAVESTLGTSGTRGIELTGMAHLSASAGAGPVCQTEREEKGATGNAGPMRNCVGFCWAGPRAGLRKTKSGK